MPHFVLDHNFPWYVAAPLLPLQILISPLTRIDPSLTADHEDYEILVALSKRGDIDGFITNDTAMLQQTREMYALSRTRLTLVMTDGVGHQALKATALVMLYIEDIVARLKPYAQIFILRPSRAIEAKDIRKQLEILARREHKSVQELKAELDGSIGHLFG